MDILVIKVSSFGDIVHGLQVAASLKAQVPGCRITWLVRDRFAGIVRASGVVDECWEFTFRDGILGGSGLRRRLLAASFNAAVDLQGRLKTAIWARTPKAKRVIGRADAREFAGIFYGEKPALPPGGRYGAHALEILMKFLPLFGAEERLAGPLTFPESPAPACDPALLAQRPILLFPDSAQREKEWAGFTELTTRLANAFPDVPVIWPGWADKPEPTGVAHGNFHNLMKKVPLQQLPALVGRARLVVANDSGPMHLAAAMGVPVVGLFGPSAACRYRPWPVIPGQAIAVEAPGGRLERLGIEAVEERIISLLATAVPDQVRTHTHSHEPDRRHSTGNLGRSV